jgi:hypothetical protein
MFVLGGVCCSLHFLSKEFSVCHKLLLFNFGSKNHAYGDGHFEHMHLMILCQSSSRWFMHPVCCCTWKTMAQYNFSPRNFTSVLSSTTQDLNNLANKLCLGNEIAKNQLNPTRLPAEKQVHIHPVLFKILQLSLCELQTIMRGIDKTIVWMNDWKLEAKSYHGFPCQ